ncbi:hypothetical protein ASD00_08525 [Ensifer sp. Root31]|nr:hypothetical protein ASD00_08525 [Ensifer sp. Root31]
MLQTHRTAAIRRNEARRFNDSAQPNARRAGRFRNEPAIAGTERKAVKLSAAGMSFHAAPPSLAPSKKQPLLKFASALVAVRVSIGSASAT